MLLLDGKSLAAWGDFKLTVDSAVSIGGLLANGLMVTAAYFLKGFHVTISAGFGAGGVRLCDCAITANAPLAWVRVFSEILRPFSMPIGAVGIPCGLTRDECLLMCVP